MYTKLKKSEATKKRIIQSAQKLFQQKGFDATSVREIVEDAGYAKGTFYLYFETKVDLLVYITNSLFEVFYEVLSKELSVMSDEPFTQIDNFIREICLRILESGLDFRLLHTSEIFGIISEQKIDDHFINKTIDKITEFLDEGINRGFFRKLDSKLYGRIIFDISHHLMESVMLYEYPTNMEIATRELSLIIRKIIEK
ncbi:MAG: TetR/AcrR family transcriptional regulator [Clostridiales bacterium]|jgi:AcrR family transcriptional regulator|nr:TetR/AcrR family transcriptional regulator [Clostridiales bacterium]